MYKDRLWDDEGQEWTTRLEEHLDASDVERWLSSSGGTGRAVVRGSRGPMRWMTRPEARAWWSSHGRHHLTRDPGASPDELGLMYSPELWRRGDQLLLSFEESC